VIKSIFIIYLLYLFYCFNSKKTAADAHRFISEIYSESASSVKTCEYCDSKVILILKDKECSGQLKKFEDAEFQASLDENSARTLENLAKALNVYQLFLIIYTQWEKFK